MSLDPEEFKKRREQRKANQQEDKKARQRTIKKLIIAAVVIVLCGILILVVSRQSAQQPPPPDDSDTTSQSENLQDTAEDPTTVIHLSAAGDLNITDGVIHSGSGDFNYTDTFLDVAHLLGQADISVVNFEGTFYGSPYGSESKSAPQSMAEALAKAGVDYVQLANSYAIHHGLSGLTSTIQAVRSAGMEPLGVYASNAEYKAGKGYTIREVRGVRIAFVAFTKGMDGLALPAGSENCVNVLYTDYASTYQQVDTEGIQTVLDNIKRERPDITVALLHWGSEFNDNISKTQNTICSLLQENGVDAIIGTHPHYVQKMTYNPDNGQFVAYSLGDFIGDAQRAGSEYSVLLDLEITKDNKSGDTKITNYHYTPIFTVTEEDRPLRVVRISEAIQAFESNYIDRVSQGTYDAMKYALERIESRVKGD